MIAPELCECSVGGEVLLGQEMGWSHRVQAERGILLSLILQPNQSGTWKKEKMGDRFEKLSSKLLTAQLVTSRWGLDSLIELRGTLDRNT